MKMLSRLGVACAVLAAGSVGAQERVTFTKDVLPILQQQCIACHRVGGNNVAGMVAPMAFTTYEEVRPWSKAILRAIKQGKMPPWSAAPEFDGVFHNERRLTPEQIATIERWVETGAPRGNPEDAPPPIEFPESNGWNIGEPDLVIYMPEPYWVADEVDDLNISFETVIKDEELPRNRWLRAIEWRADSDVVHHIVGGSTAPGDVKFPDGSSSQSLGSIAPGEDPTIYPEGYGKILHKGSTIRFGMHYHKEPGPGTGVWDRSMIGFRFWDEEKDPPVTRQVHWNGISGFDFEIPPGYEKWPMGVARVFENDTTILSLHPHMHLRGMSMKYTAYYPDGTNEVLLDVPAYDYNWQINYVYDQPKLIPAGTRIEVTGTYNNSSSNPSNPDPTRPIRNGSSTDKHEMFIGFISYCDTKPMTIEESRRHLELGAETD